MVAYSFKKRFVDPIRWGLGLAPLEIPAVTFPKRQTIRAVGKRRHARPGETIQLYHGMRTKQSFAIGVARCVSVDPISISIPLDDAFVLYRLAGGPIIEADDAFARADGFGSVEDMWLFWRENHPDIPIFEGLLIEWEPISQQLLESADD